MLYSHTDDYSDGSVQFTAKSLQRQAKKATKDEGLEKAKLKKVGSYASSFTEGKRYPTDVPSLSLWSGSSTRKH